jgi:hypothetical protein
MNNTPIGALPLEIREMVYENFFGGDFFRVSLAPLTICDEMNAEANRTLARIHKTAILDCGNDNTSALTAPDFNQLRVLAQRFSAIPQNLKSRLTFEVQHDCSLLDRSKPSPLALPSAMQNSPGTSGTSLRRSARVTW